MQLAFLSILSLILTTFQPHVDLAVTEGVVGPVIGGFIQEAIAQAEGDGAQLLIIQLDTPGGLDTSMREIVKAVLDSEVPICVYVYPPGSRAASAGVFITMAAHVAAMAPGTNIGAAHPVTMGGEMDEEMSRKVTNDAAAYIRSIAEKRGRNGDWAVSSVKESFSITGEEALDLGVVDIVAGNLDELLAQLDGREVELEEKTVTLTTSNASVNRLEMGFRERLLSGLANPNVAYIFLILGLLGVYFELQSPGTIFPGVVGVICLVIAFFAFQTLPVNFAGLILIVFGIVLFVLETQITSYGMLTVGGIISLFLGSFMLVRVTPPILAISWKVIVPSVVFIAVVFAVAMGLALKAQRSKPTTGMKGIVGEVGVTRTRVKEDGRIFVHGEIWNATSEDAIDKGVRAIVVGIEGLTLKIEKV
jgi:membrane-bound serine protease (ClpP class)